MDPSFLTKKSKLHSVEKHQYMVVGKLDSCPLTNPNRVILTTPQKAQHSLDQGPKTSDQTP